MLARRQGDRMLGFTPTGVARDWTILRQRDGGGKDREGALPAASTGGACGAGSHPRAVPEQL